MTQPTYTRPENFVPVTPPTRPLRRTPGDVSDDTRVRAAVSGALGGPPGLTNRADRRANPGAAAQETARRSPVGTYLISTALIGGAAAAVSIGGAVMLWLPAAAGVVAFGGRRLGRRILEGARNRRAAGGSSLGRRPNPGRITNSRGGGGLPVRKPSSLGAGGHRSSRAGGPLSRASAAHTGSRTRMGAGGRPGPRTPTSGGMRRKPTGGSSMSSPGISPSRRKPSPSMPSPRRRPTSTTSGMPSSPRTRSQTRQRAASVTPAGPPRSTLRTGTGVQAARAARARLENAAAARTGKPKTIAQKLRKRANNDLAHLNLRRAAAGYAVAAGVATLKWGTFPVWGTVVGVARLVGRRVVVPVRIWWASTAHTPATAAAAAEQDQAAQRAARGTRRRFVVRTIPQAPAPAAATQAAATPSPADPPAPDRAQPPSYPTPSGDAYDTDVDGDRTIAPAVAPPRPAPPENRYPEGARVKAVQQAIPFAPHDRQLPAIETHDRLFGVGAIPNSVTGMCEHLHGLQSMYYMIADTVEGLAAQLRRDTTAGDLVYMIMTDTGSTIRALVGKADAALAAYRIANPEDIRRTEQPRDNETWANVREGTAEGVNMLQLRQHFLGTMVEALNYKPSDPPDLMDYLFGWHNAWTQMALHVQLHAAGHTFPGIAGAVTEYWNMIGEQYIAVSVSHYTSADAYVTDPSNATDLDRWKDPRENEHLANAGRKG